jgi:hypothetical protein
MGKVERERVSRYICDSTKASSGDSHGEGDGEGDGEGEGLSVQRQFTYNHAILVHPLLMEVIHMECQTRFPIRYLLGASPAWLPAAQRLNAIP